MIIVDGDDTKAPAGERQPLVSGSGPSQQQLAQEPEPAPPPPYQPPAQPHTYQGAPQEYVASPTALEGVVVYRYHESPAARFWKAFAAATLIWFLFAVLTDSIVEVARFDQSYPYYRGRRTDKSNTGYPLAADGKILRCAGSKNETWEAYRSPSWSPVHSQGADAEFEIPIDSDVIYLFTRGGRQYGDIHLSTETSSSDNIQISVRTAYHDSRAIEGAHVCLLERGSHEQGVGIFVPSWTGTTSYADQLKFDITLTFPARRYGPAKRRVRKLEVNSPRYNIDAGELQSKILFNHINLVTANAAIKANSLVCDTGTILTTNAPISGHFSASTSLSLTTSNGHIDTSISLTNKFDHTPSALSLTTTNAPIDARVGLYAPVPYDGAGSRFNVSARTENGPLTLGIVDMPHNAAELALQARTKNADAEVRLPPAFEGHFDVHTSAYKTASLVAGRADDPAGMDRQRRVQYTESEGEHVAGVISWAEGNARRGSADVSTLNGRAMLMHGY